MQYGGISTFSTQKISPQKFAKITKILNYILNYIIEDYSQKRINTFWSGVMNIFWPGGISTFWPKKSDKKNW